LGTVALLDVAIAMATWGPVLLIVKHHGLCSWVNVSHVERHHELEYGRLNTTLLVLVSHAMSDSVQMRAVLQVEAPADVECEGVRLRTGASDEQ
jgi:hypothetical protein